MSVSHAALITGCSSGIGRATALRLHAAGLPVYATARHVDDLPDLVAKDVTTLALALTDAESMDVAVKRISAEHGAVGILVTTPATPSWAPSKRSRSMTLGCSWKPMCWARLIQLVLPGMREQRFGRIINRSSMYGRFAVPARASTTPPNMLWRALRGDGYLATAFAVRALNAGGKGTMRSQLGQVPTWLFR
jgi:NADP-dependent 3-hydroxy acid dehydrogenase YdfG